LTSEALREKIKAWASENLLSPTYLAKLDLDAEIDSKLNFGENIRLLEQKFPSLWSSSKEEKPRQMVLVKRLIEPLLNQEKICTYRPYQMHGKYYLVSSRFDQMEGAKAIIEVLKVEEICDPDRITDEEARWAGVKDRKELFELFEKWYPERGKKAMRYRNFLQVIEKL
jgi:hypothetical protein